ncbi:MAG TPA: 1,2-phenylacetyl-CoA epoxidase subunit PaaD [Steroidobacteraceae bacterium]|nr:1,2-phenylacetyl-CoA epoxidase subunit PaaD [Steroidobacteraceae bacterium]
MAARAQAATALSPELLARLNGILAQVADPEIPVLSVLDLGVVRHLLLRADGRLEVGISPTYSGCPANAVIKADVLRALEAAGFAAVAVDVLAPPWSSDWLSEAGRRKLEAFGIAPPGAAQGGPRGRKPDQPAACPRCGSTRTTRTSEFGSTPCKALYRCDACLEPFDYFKCI